MKVPYIVRLKLFELAQEQGEAAVQRATAGVRLVEIGKSEVCPDGSVVVRAPGRGDRKIVKGAPCSCDDVKYKRAPLDRCKHVWAANAITLATREQKKRTDRSYLA